ncbi:MAG: hypothetical protein LUH05_05640 [Candidatus Gastranaerophilales bacterium]|nr:hypothetical protein [Candidatus Gastranaerophilales bacterium]
MNISAARISPSFGMDCDCETAGQFDEYKFPVNEGGKIVCYEADDANRTIQLCDSYLNNAKKDDLKSPLMIAGSVAASILATYATGKIAASRLTVIPFMEKVPVAVEEKLKSASGNIQNYAKKLISDSPEGTVNKLKNAAGKTMKNLEKAARTGYKKIAYVNTENVKNPERARRAFTNVSGTVAVASLVPKILSSDHNEDGIKDVAQKSQNAYTGRRNDIYNTVNNLTMFGELIEAFT